MYQSILKQNTYFAFSKASLYTIKNQQKNIEHKKVDFFFGNLLTAASGSADNSKKVPKSM